MGTAGARDPSSTRDPGLRRPAGADRLDHRGDVPVAEAGGDRLLEELLDGRGDGEGDPAPRRELTDEVDVLAPEPRREPALVVPVDHVVEAVLESGGDERCPAEGGEEVVADAMRLGGRDRLGEDG